MYVYDEYDQRIIEDRVKQFRDQTRRYLAGELSEEEFRPLRLQNGLYVQRFAPMLRVAVPYGQLTSRQTRMMAKIARDFDKGYAHISTRQNVQFNWPALEDVPDILAELATVQMHAIQTSGNCLRNVTTDQFAGVAADELIDPRPWCEIVRQWTTFHPEFAYLPRKFKIAITGAPNDRAAVKFHDIGLMASAKGYSLFVDSRFETPVLDMLADLHAGKIEAAVLWGPLAGPIIKQKYSEMQLTLLLIEALPPRMFFRITMGVRQGERVWKRKLNALIRRNQPEIDQILREAGVPLVTDMGTGLKPINP